MSRAACIGLQSFSEAICDLYGAAETNSLDDFPPALVSVLQRHLQFDGAVVGHADPLSYGSFSISMAYVHQRAASLLDEYKLISSGDPVTQAFLQGLAEPLAVDSESLYAKEEHAAVLAYSRRHRLRHLLLCGHAPSHYQRGQWIVLYRSVDQCFDEESVRWFGAFCNHLDRALDLNRDRAIGHLPPASRRKGVALIDQQGRVEKADAMFLALLKTEFRNAQPHRLPEGLLVSMQQGRVFEGRAVRGHFSPVGSHHVCELREAGLLSLLTPRESQVARRFAHGRNAREIANEFGVTLSTVHSHIASAYRKLGVTNKAVLAQVVGGSDG